MHLDFKPDGIRRLAEIAFAVNEKQENIGARRLYTVMERLLDDVSFHATRHTGETIAIDAAYVDERLERHRRRRQSRALHPLTGTAQTPCPRARSDADAGRILGIILPVFAGHRARLPLRAARQARHDVGQPDQHDRARAGAHLLGAREQGVRPRARTCC